MDKLVRSEKGTEEEEEAVQRAGRHVGEFVKRRWVEEEWETAWFVNPPVGVPFECPGDAVLNSSFGG